MVDFPPSDPALKHLAGRNMIFTVGPNDSEDRLDKFTAEASGLSRGKVRDLIDFGSVWVRGKVCRKQSRVLAPGDYIAMQVPAYGPVRFYEADPARIIFRDEVLLAYDKEPGIPCQQTPYDGYNHLFGALQRFLGPEAYLALHHRLDRLTSGVMVFSVSQRANQSISRLFSQRGIGKTYLAVVQGEPEREEWEVDQPIAKRKGEYYCPEDGQGKPARTAFRVLASGQGRTLIQARPLTGRTHQIRLHLKACGMPIIGDEAYGGIPAERMMLHALSLEFEHPVNGRAMKIASEAPLGFRPEDYSDKTITG